MGHSPWAHKESDVTERLNTFTSMTNEIKYTIHFNQEQKQKQYISCKFSLHNPGNDELL